jgi:membrane dipeptidase
LLVADAHCDTASIIYDKSLNLYENNLHLDIKRIQKYNNYIQTFAFWLSPYSDNPMERLKLLHKNLLNEFKKNSQYIILAKTYDEIERGIENKKIIGILSIEDGVVLGDEINNLDILYNMGIRLITLTWNNTNSIATGVDDKEDKGLSEFGHKVIKRMNELGMVVDLSHISIKSFWDVLETTDKPIIASHSNSKSLCSHRRNISDNQFKAIIKNGGVVGINLYSNFLSDGAYDASLITIINHIEHFLSLGGENNICMGSDFDGMDKMPDGICGCENIQDIINILLKYNYNEDIIRKIIGNNLVNLYKSII